MAVRKLTKSAVESLASGDTMWDTEVRGFGARRRQREITFVLKTRVKGQQAFLTIGRFGAPWTVDLARKEAQRLLAEELQRALKASKVESRTDAEPTQGT